MTNLVVIGITCGAISAYFASRKGYPVVTAFLIGAILWLPVFIYAFLPDKSQDQ